MNCGKRMGRMKETKKFKDNWQKYFGPALGIGAVFLIWYLVCRMEMVSAYVLPSPARVWTSFLKMVKTGELWRDIAEKLHNILIVNAAARKQRPEHSQHKGKQERNRKSLHDTQETD